MADLRPGTVGTSTPPRARCSLAAEARAGFCKAAPCGGCRQPWRRGAGASCQASARLFTAARRAFFRRIGVGVARLHARMFGAARSRIHSSAPALLP